MVYALIVSSGFADFRVCGLECGFSSGWNRFLGFGVWGLGFTVSLGSLVVGKEGRFMDFRAGDEPDSALGSTNTGPFRHQGQEA